VWGLTGLAGWGGAGRDPNSPRLQGWRRARANTTSRPPRTLPPLQDKLTTKAPFKQYASLPGLKVVWGSPTDYSAYPEGPFDVVYDNNGKDLDSCKPLIDASKVRRRGAGAGQLPHGPQAAAAGRPARRPRMLCPLAAPNRAALRRAAGHGEALCVCRLRGRVQGRLDRADARGGRRAQGERRPRGGGELPQAGGAGLFEGWGAMWRGNEGGWTRGRRSRSARQ
jgi:hypothetical protein